MKKWQKEFESIGKKEVSAETLQRVLESIP